MEEPVFKIQATNIILFRVYGSKDFPGTCPNSLEENNSVTSQGIEGIDTTWKTHEGEANMHRAKTPLDKDQGPLPNPFNAWPQRRPMGSGYFLSLSYLLKT